MTENSIYQHQQQPNWFDRHHMGFINLVLYVLRDHSPQETDWLSNAKPVSIHKLDGLWPRPWLYSRVLFFFALAFAIMYLTWVTVTSFEGYQAGGILMPSLTMIGALGTPLAMVIFLYECNKFRSITILRVFQYMIMGSVISILITFVINVVLDYGMNVRFSVPQTVSGYMPMPIRAVKLAWFFDAHPVIPVVVYAAIEEFSKAMLIFYYLMKYRDRCYILQGMLIGASVGAGFAIFESAGYAFIYNAHLLDSIIGRGLTAPVCHTAWGAILGGGVMMLSKRNLKWRFLFNPKFLFLFLLICALHSVWNCIVDFALPLTYTIELGFFTVFLMLMMLWRGVIQVRHFKALGYLPIAMK